MKEMTMIINREIGEECRLMREEMGYSQERLSDEIEKYMIGILKSWGFTDIEISSYICDDIDLMLRKKLEKKDIKNPYHPIAISTISNYETGSCKIPAWYKDVVEKIFECKFSHTTIK